VQEYEYLHLDYDPVINGEYWSRRPVLVIKRALQVLCWLTAARQST
jgi:hypothetical protein